jgi:hypothetical protein
MTFTKAFFMYHIDKFFSKEMSVVLHAIDDEYDKFLATQKKKDDDLQREIEDLDDYFLNEKDAQRSPPEISPQPTGRKLRDQEQAQPHHEDDMPPQHQPSVAQLHLQKTIKEFESSLQENKFSSQEEQSEMQKILDSLRTKLSAMMQRGGTQLKNSPGYHNERLSQVLDISELRRRGLQEIFNFYSR